MKKINFKNNSFGILVSGLILIFFVVFIALISFTFRKVDLTMYPSSIPSYDKTKIDKISDILRERQDINTQGKPNVDKFNFGNPEPF